MSVIYRRYTDHILVRQKYVHTHLYSLIFSLHLYSSLLPLLLKSTTPMEIYNYNNKLMNVNTKTKRVSKGIRDYITKKQTTKQKERKKSISVNFLAKKKRKKEGS